MDLVLAKTFLEIAESGSFVTAAGKLNVTQTAVSARVRTLEEQLGRRLFVRNKAGARLTPAGERFVKHAANLIQVWDRARLQVGLPEGRVDIASVGAEISLWNPTLVDWLTWMRQEHPDVAIAAEVDTTANLLERVKDGSLDMAVAYDPPHSGHLVVELLVEERLIMVTSRPDGTIGRQEDYVYVDWGMTFQASHQAAFPDLGVPDVSISHGPLALLYIAQSGGSGYFRQSAVKEFLDAGTLYRVADAPEFAYSMHLVYSNRAETSLVERVRSGFLAIRDNLEFGR
ncbi:LysR family transcriptional regulator [Devosia naphthalenivorans]|uniref:LysR family transcriptional regulator n=1 Tax=Devosia naphthalenivorans TaxID=2082392 RepID=UPI000D37F0A7|nr:LysR family transcriptional regulator [Devosia naphthalenivorans]